MKPQPASKNPSVIGGAGIQLRQHASEKYISYKFPSNVLGWKQQWFYIVNHAPNSLRVQADLLFSAPNGPWSLLRQIWTR
jgi:hypothetical protein